MDNMYLTVMVGAIAFLLGFFGRMVQGGQISMGGLPGYRPFAYFTYGIPTLFAFLICDPDLFDRIRLLGPDAELSTFREVGIPLVVVLGSLALSIIPHARPEHGKTMDMGHNNGTLRGDYMFMLWRFMIPMGMLTAMLALVYPSGSFTPWQVLPFVIAGFAPPTVYAVSWWIWGRMNWFAPTEMAERFYGGIYQSAIAIGIIVSF